MDSKSFTFARSPLFAALNSSLSLEEFMMRSILKI